MIKRIPFIQQMEQSECGLACIAMILNYYKHAITLTELRQSYSSSKQGLSFYEIKVIFQEFHLNPKVYQFPKDRLSELKKERLEPFIAHWRENHFVVVEKIRNKTVIVVDPEYGRRVLSHSEFTQEVTGYIMLIKGEENLPYKKSKPHFIFLKEALLDNKNTMLLLLFLSVVMIGVSIIIPYMSKWITDDVLGRNNIELLQTIGIAILLLFISRSLITLIRGYVVARFQKQIDLTMMTRFNSHLLNLPYSFLEARAKGDLLYRTNSNVQIRDIISERVIGSILDLLLIVVLAITMLYQSIFLGSIIILSSLLILSVLFITTPITRNLMNKQVISQVKTQNVLSNNLDNLGDIKSMGLEKQAYFEWKRKFNTQVDNFEKSNRWMAWLNTFSSSIQVIMPVVILWIGSYKVLNHDITLGTVLYISTMANIYLMPIIMIGGGYMQFVYLGAILQRLNDILHQPKEKNGHVPVKNFKGNIDLVGVTYKHSYFEKPSVKNIHMRIKNGDKIGINGTSGSGKSTLVKLICGLYEPVEGTLYYDKVPNQSIDKNFLKEKVSTVLQESTLFNQSILKNIAGVEKKDINMKKVIEVTKLAQIYNDIEDLPMKFETFVHENGNNFSGGQRQRILIARALYRSPELLILDEATNAIDPHIEKNIIQNIKKLPLTVIFVSHQEELINEMDRTFEVNNGRIQENFE